MISQPHHDARAMLAASVRRLRIARRLSLSELARETGVSKATLSGIENGRGNPTVDTLSALARALHTDAGELLAGPPAVEVRVVRAREGAAQPSLAGPARLLDCLAAASGQVEAWEAQLAPGEARDMPAGDSGDRRAVLVLAGRVIAGPAERITELDAGDYASFPADGPQRLEAGPKGASVLVLLAGGA